MDSNRFSRHSGMELSPKGYYSSYRDFRTNGYLNLEERIFLFCEMLKRNQAGSSGETMIQHEDSEQKPRKKKSDPGGPAGHGPHLSIR